MQIPEMLMCCMFPKQPTCMVTQDYYTAYFSHYLFSLPYPYIVSTSQSILPISSSRLVTNPILKKKKRKTHTQNNGDNNFSNNKLKYLSTLEQFCLCSVFTIPSYHSNKEVFFLLKKRPYLRSIYVFQVDTRHK